MKETASQAIFRKQLGIVVLLINLVVVVLVGISVRQSRIQYEELAIITTQNLSHVLEEYISGVIAKTDIAVLSVVDEVERQLAVGGINGLAINTCILRQRDRIPELDGLRMTNKKGDVVYGSDVKPSFIANVSDREYFFNQRDDPKRGLFISRPLVSRVTGREDIFISRRYNLPNGSFGGEAHGVILLQKIHDTFSKVNVGKRGIITLFNSDLNIICRYTQYQQSGSFINKKLTATELRDLIDRGQTSGTYKVRSSVDNIERVFSYLKISSYPIYIVVGLAKDDYLAEWRKETAKMLAFGALFLLGVLSLAWLLYRHVTEREVSEEKLKESEEKYRVLIETTNTGFVILNKDGLVLDANSDYVRMTGYQRLEEILGRPVIEWTADYDRAKNALEVKKCFEEGFVRNFNIDYADKYGKITPIEINATVVDTKSGRLIVTLCRDITERKRMEHALIESEQKFKLMAEASPFAILHLSPDSEQRVLYINPTFGKLFGYTLEEVPNLTEWCQRAYPDEKYRNQLIAEWQRRVEHAIKTSSGIEPMEVVVTCKDGFKRNISWGYTSTGTQNYAFGLDITDRKMAEKEIKLSLKEKETLLKEIHHRVKNNMAVVSSLLDLQANVIKDDTVKQLFEESGQRVKSMALVHEKLYGTKDLSSINFKDYITAIIQEIKALYRIDHSLITTELDVEDIELDLESAVPCGLIINELLTNVFKYAFPDGRKGVLNVHFIKTNDTYTLTVRDNGVGLPEGFDYKETGTLGLRIVNVLVEQLGGDLTIKSEKGLEAVVTFTTKNK